MEQFNHFLIKLSIHFGQPWESGQVSSDPSICLYLKYLCLTYTCPHPIHRLSQRLYSYLYLYSQYWLVLVLVLKYIYLYSCTALLIIHDNKMVKIPSTAPQDKIWPTEKCNQQKIYSITEARTLGIPFGMIL